MQTGSSEGQIKTASDMVQMWKAVAQSDDVPFHTYVDACFCAAMGVAADAIRAGAVEKDGTVESEMTIKSASTGMERSFKMVITEVVS